LIPRLSSELKNKPVLEPQTLGSEAGQASILLILMLGTFLLASLAFAVDLSGIWFLRQSAQSAADSACLAGAADMLVTVSGVTPPSAGFTVGTAGDCSSSPGASICRYANFNGYNGAGFSSTAASNSVAWSFPSSVSGATAPSGVTNPFLQVLVSQNTDTYFMGLLGRKFQKVTAASTCGLVSIKSVPPLLILNPTASGTFSTSGSGSSRLNIVGGPSRSIQVNSSSSTAVSAGSNPIVDTSGAGPSGTGGDIGIVGGPATAPTNWLLGAGKWTTPTLPIPDPYRAVPAPTKPAAPANPNGVSVPQNTDGCPDTSCLEFSPGYYASGISVSGTTIFKPGIYWMDGSITASGHSTLRNASSANQTDGVMFYFHQGSMQIAGNSGTTIFTPALSSAGLKCSPSSPSPSGVPATLNGNVLWSQCTANGTYVGAGSSDTFSSSGTRGLLIFNAYSNSSTPSTAGNGSLAFSGTMYFHNTANNATWNISGNGGSGTYLVGNIVTDKMTLAGNGTVLLSLNPAATINVLKVALLQ
jgi:hypothetical protein